MSGVKITELRVPDLIYLREGFWMNCTYDLETELLYSIKWFKKNNEVKEEGVWSEIYRYIPNEEKEEVKRTFPMRGVRIDETRSNLGNVFFTTADQETEGTYKCEVSADAPTFETVREERETRVYCKYQSGTTHTHRTVRHDDRKERRTGRRVNAGKSRERGRRGLTSRPSSDPRSARDRRSRHLSCQTNDREPLLLPLLVLLLLHPASSLSRSDHLHRLCSTPTDNQRDQSRVHDRRVWYVHVSLWPACATLWSCVCVYVCVCAVHDTAALLIGEADAGFPGPELFCLPVRMNEDDVPSIFYHVCVCPSVSACTDRGLHHLPVCLLSPFAMALVQSMRRV